jgi:hypothetical protein
MTGEERMENENPEDVIQQNADDAHVLSLNISSIERPLTPRTSQSEMHLDRLIHPRFPNEDESVQAVENGMREGNIRINEDTVVLGVGGDTDAPVAINADATQEAEIMEQGIAGGLEQNKDDDDDHPSEPPEIVSAGPSVSVVSSPPLRLLPDIEAQINRTPVLKTRSILPLEVPNQNEKGYWDNFFDNTNSGFGEEKTTYGKWRLRKVGCGQSKRNHPFSPLSAARSECEVFSGGRSLSPAPIPSISSCYSPPPQLSLLLPASTSSDSKFIASDTSDSSSSSSYSPKSIKIFCMNSLSSSDFFRPTFSSSCSLKSSGSEKRRIPDNVCDSNRVLLEIDENKETLSFADVDDEEDDDDSASLDNLRMDYSTYFCFREKGRPRINQERIEDLFTEKLKLHGISENPPQLDNCSDVNLNADGDDVSWIPPKKGFELEVVDLNELYRSFVQQKSNIRNILYHPDSHSLNAKMKMESSDNSTTNFDRSNTALWEYYNVWKPIEVKGNEISLNASRLNCPSSKNVIQGIAHLSDLFGSRNGSSFQRKDFEALENSLVAPRSSAVGTPVSLQKLDRLEADTLKFLSSEPSDMVQLRKKQFTVVRSSKTSSFTFVKTPSFDFSSIFETGEKESQGDTPKSPDLTVSHMSIDKGVARRDVSSNLTHLRLWCDTRPLSNLFMQTLALRHPNLTHVDLAGGSMIDDDGVAALMQVCRDIKV